MLWAIAWRNLWRNPRRTAITLTALTLGVVAVVSIHSYRESVFTTMLEEITTGLVGHVQIHAKGYQADPELTNVVRDPLAVEAKLEAAIPGARPLRRVLGYGLAGSGDSSSAALVVGIDPAREHSGDGTYTVVDGQGLTPSGAKEAVLGRELAVELGAKVGSELVLVGQAADGAVANDRFRVVGVADAGSSEMNGTAVFLRIRDAQDFFDLGDGVHQIIVHLPTHDEDLSEPLSALRGSLDLSTLEVLSWSQILPELKGTIDQKRKQQRVLDFVVLFIIGLGVLNAMTMATFERTRELGVLASLGTRPRRIVAMILGESLLQGVLGSAIGIAIAFVMLKAIGTIDLSSMGQQDTLGVRLPSLIHLRMDWGSLLSATTTALLTVLLGGLWPAWRASRLEPVEATRYV